MSGNCITIRNTRTISQRHRSIFSGQLVICQHHLSLWHSPNKKLTLFMGDFYFDLTGHDVSGTCFGNKGDGFGN